jgi:D-tyrosyl-tRNA(Tyr) deacylase
MKIVAQRVNSASVTVEEKEIFRIGKGLLLFLGIGAEDSSSEVEWLANKIINLRIFEDENGKMNRSVLDVNGEILLISQFTLYANCQRGRRPDFIHAAPPELAEKMYLEFAENLTTKGIKSKMGIFAAHMNIALENNGPVTILLEKENNK